MKKLIITFVFVLSATCFMVANAQVNQTSKNGKNPDIERLEAQKEKIANKEKELLKKQVEKINKALEEGDITAEEAKEQKEVAAEKHAQNIADQHRIIDANISLILRNKDKKDDRAYYEKMEYLDDDEEADEPTRSKRRTYGVLVVNFGFSNTITSGKFIGDDYKVAGSRFFDIGYEWSTGLVKSNFLRINYGLNLQFNGLKAKDNQYFVKNGNQVELQDFGHSLKKSKLRMDNLVIPVHFELGSTDYKGYADRFKVGLGGYAGLNLRTIQKLKYKADGNRIKSKNYFNSQTEDFIYGLSGYVGYDNWALFVKYDLNPIFKNNEIDEQIIAAGVRIML